MSYVLTSLSGNLISAASAGYAPTNGAEVSAIASAYATGKQDALTFGYDDDDKISAINGSALAGQGGGLVTAVGTSDSGITSLNNSGLVDTAALHSADYSSLYVQEPLYISASGNSSYIGISGNVGGIDSATCSAIASSYATGKQDVLTFGYDGNSAISSIDGSALAGGGTTGDYVEKSAEVVAIGNSASAAGSDALAQGYKVSAKSYGLAQGLSTLANSYAFGQGHSNSAWSYSLAQGLSNRASSTSFAQGVSNSASSNSFAQGNHLSALYSSVVFGGYNLHGNGNTATGDSAAFAIGDGTASDARHDLMLVTKDGEITMYSSTADTVGTGIMSSIRALSANAGGVDSATVSSIASSYAESAASSKQDTLTFGYDSNKISAINGSALAGEAQVVTAVGTDTAYTPDGVSDVVTSINGNYISALSADSAFQASYDEDGRELTSLASEYSVSAIASSYAESAASSKADSSALSSYALSADVSGTVDLVSTQSANWGGSALALSAGPGVSLTKSGNVLVAGLDETLLWSGSLAAVDNATLTASSSPTDYRSIKFVFEGYADNQRAPQELYFSGCDKEFDIMPIGFIGTGIRLNHVRLKFAGTVGTFSETVQYNITTTIATSVDRPYLRAIYGINRTAEA